MFRKLFVAVALVAFVTPVAFADDEKKPTRPGKAALAGKADKSKVFATMDADADGKLSKDEFRTAMDKMAEKLKDRAEGKGGKLAGAMDKIAEKAFEKLDADKDGSISKDEFEKSDLDLSKLKDLREKLGKGK